MKRTYIYLVVSEDGKHHGIFSTEELAYAYAERCKWSWENRYYEINYIEIDPTE